jgi:hypothetical protein
MKVKQLRQLIREEIQSVKKTSVKKTSINENMDYTSVYWSIMVDEQPEDVKQILVDLYNGKLSYRDFLESTEADIYDSFKDEMEEDEFDEFDEFDED